MKLFLWQYIQHITDEHHNGGGLVIVAKDLSAAYEAIRRDPSMPIQCGAFTSEPSEIYDVGDVPPTLITFPDSGCC